MKQTKTLLLIMLCCISPFLLTAENGEKVLLNNTWSFGVGQVKLFDSYLSPFEFTGMGYRLDATHSAFYKGCDRRVSWSNWNHLGYANTYNPPYSAAINYLEGSIGYGSYYHFTPIKNLILKVGGMVTAEAGIKYLARNVNNIASADLALMLHIGGTARYNLEFNKFTLGFQYQVSTPALGVMFVPQMGQSYYELYLNLPDGLDKVTHFASFHNRAGVDGNFSIDLMFTGFTLRLGSYQQYLQWHANNLYFHKAQLSGYIGMVIDLNLFSGMQSRGKNSINYY